MPSSYAPRPALCQLAASETLQSRQDRETEPGGRGQVYIAADGGRPKVAVKFSSGRMGISALPQSAPTFEIGVRNGSAEGRERFAAGAARVRKSPERRANSGHQAQIDDYIGRLQLALASLPRQRLAEVGQVLLRAYRNDKQVFMIGNGGSSSTASHMAADLAKNTIGSNMKHFRVRSLGDNASILTALANDIGYDSVFSEQLVNVICAGDVLVVISASGSSSNILKAIRFAQRQSAEIVGLLGFDGGVAARLVDIPIVVPSRDYGIIEDVHLAINHMLVEYFKDHLIDSRPWLA